MKLRRYLAVVPLILAITFVSLTAATGEEKPDTKTESQTDFIKPVMVLEFSGIINPVAAEFLAGNISKINDANSASLIVITMDTPGGLDTSMRIIVKEIMASSIPVAVYVSPSGSRAASAGTFIAMASHISAMAPGTSQGAASPVPGAGQEMSRTMEKKVQNDAASYIRSLAQERGRNEKWAEEAVRKAVSVDEKEALKEKIIDYVAVNLKDLLKQIDKIQLVTATGPKVLNTENAELVFIGMTERQKFLDIISNPTVAYILLMIGFYGIFFELSNPGVVLPGIVGGICLILGFFALQSLPVNYAGILLLLLAMILFVAELFVPTFGALTLGGVVSMILGAIMLIDHPDEYMKIDLRVVVPVALSMGAFFFFMVSWAIFMKPRVMSIGVEGLIGETGIAITPLNPNGSAEIEGEIWEVHSMSGNLEKGATIKVIKKDGHHLIVESFNSDDADKTEPA